MSTKRWRLILALALIFISGCSHQNVRPEGATPDSGVQPGEMGPPPPPEGPMGPEVPIGPLPTADFTQHKDSYVLVLGPGLARGFAYLGVLREMEAHGLQIRGIVGVEIGALIGTIWASANTNHLEWEMHKFKRSTLLDLPLLGLRNRVAEGKKLYDFLNEALKVNLLQKTKVPVLVASAVPNAESILVESNGSAKDIVRGAMGIPGVIKLYTFEDKERETAALESPFPVSQAKALNLGKVVCVDVIGRGDNFKPKEAVEEQLATLMRSVAALARQSLKECDIVLSVQVDGVSYLDFDLRADLINQGKAAVKKWLEPPK